MLVQVSETNLTENWKNHLMTIKSLHHRRLFHHKIQDIKAPVFFPGYTYFADMLLRSSKIHGAHNILYLGDFTA